MEIKNRFFLNKEDALLVVIDVQDKLVAAMDQKELEQLLKNSEILLETATELEIPILITEQYKKGLGDTLQNLKDKAIGASYYEKLEFSCCGNQDFVSKIKNSARKQIIITGMETHVCVLQTVIELLDEGYSVHIVNDALLSRSSKNKETAISAMVSAGAVPTSTESVLFQLLKVAGTDSFKKLSKLVK